MLRKLTFMSIIIRENIFFPFPSKAFDFTRNNCLTFERSETPVVNEFYLFRFLTMMILINLTICYFISNTTFLNGDLFNDTC